MNFFDKRWMTIHFDTSLLAVCVEWKGYAEGEDFRSGFNRGIELLQQRRASRWLADCRLQGPITQADQQWMNQDWHPRAVAAGMRWVALVSPQSAVARLSVKSIVTKINNVDLVLHIFADMESARDWLRAPMPLNATPPEPILTRKSR